MNEFKVKNGLIVDQGGINVTGSSLLSGSVAITGSLSTIGSNTLIGSTSLTGSLSISGSTTQIGNNTLLGNTVLSGSIIISSSFPVGSLSSSVQIYGDTTMTGYLKFEPKSTNIDTSISASYIYVSGSTNDLYFSQNGNGYSNVTRLRWLEGNLYTGLLHGGLITTQSSTVYQVSSGSGIIVTINASLNDDPYPTTRFIEWPNLSASIAPLSQSFDQTFVAIEPTGSTGIIYVQGIPYDDGAFNTIIPIGNVIHQDHATINATATYPSVAYAYKQRTSDFIRAFGALKLSGLNTVVSGSSTGSIAITSGTSYSEGRNYRTDPNNPSYVSDTGQPNSKIYRYYQSGSSWEYLTNGGAGYTTIDPTQYSNNGTLTAVPGTGINRQWTIQRVYYFAGGATKGIYVYYGNATYDSQIEAVANIPYETFVEAPNTAAGAVLSAYLIVRNNANFTVADSYSIQQAGLFRNIGGAGGGGSSATTRLVDLSDVSITTPLPHQPLAYDDSTLKWTNQSAISASLKGNADTATTASWAINALTASSADNFTVRGTLTAQTLIVQTITASVEFVTGSTKFGSVVQNTHQFTGSVSISGSLSINGTSFTTATSGTSGTSGTAGSSGSSGTAGSSGSTGTSGSSGSTGTSGSSGTSGANGTSGSSGSSGTSGTGFTTVANAADNRILTSDGTANAANAEANITFDNSVLRVTGSFGVTGNTSISAGNLSIFTTNTPRRINLSVANGSKAAAIGIEAGGSIHSVVGIDTSGTDFLQVASKTGISFYSNSTIGDIVTDPTNERMRLTTAGRLLLGTTTESTYLLDVNGTARVSGQLDVLTAGDVQILVGGNTTNNYYTIGRSNNTGDFVINGGSNTNNFVLSKQGSQYLQLTNAGIHIGSGNPFATISTNLKTSYQGLNSVFASSPANDSYFVLRNTNDGKKIAWGHDGAGGMVFYSELLNSSFTSDNIVGKFFGTGNWSIGSTTDAGYKLDVNGTARVTGAAYLATSSGSVGIGTTSPATKLEVVGASGIQIRNASTDGFSFQQSNTNSWSWTALTAGSNYNIQNSNVGIGTAAPTRKLHVVGTSALFQNAGTFELDLLNTTSGNYLRATAGATDSNIGTIQNIPFSFIINGSRVGQFTSTNGNLILQNGGTFSDGGQRLQVYGDALISNSAASGTFFEVKRTSTTDRFFRVLSTGNIEASSISTGDPNFQFLTGANNTSTTGDRRFFWLQNNFSPTSGIATYRTLELTTVINQTGGANGITRGLYVNPTLTAAADWRSIEWSNNSGWGLYGAGTANNYLGGKLLLNSNSDNGNYSLQVNGGGSIYGSGNLLLVKSTGQYLLMGEGTGNNQYGILNWDATNNMLQISTQPFEFGTSGGQINLPLSGNILLGTTTDAGFKLDVNGTARVSGAATFSSSVTAIKALIGDNGFGSQWAVFNHADSTGASNAFVGIDNSNGSQISNIKTNGTFEWRVSNSNVMNLKTSGNLLVGTTVDSGERLQVNGSGIFNSTTPLLKLQASDNSVFHGIEFRQGAGFDAFIKQLPVTGEFRISNGRNTSWGGHITFYTDTVERLRIASTGAATFSSSATATSFIKSGGTSSQYLMADGSVTTGGGGGSVDELQVALLSQVYG